jgi:catalase
MVLQDVWFLEKLAHFDREVIPERRMHAKGSGAYGTFTQMFVDKKGVNGEDFNK